MIHQEEVEQVKLEKDREIEQLKKIPQAKVNTCMVCEKFFKS